MTKKILIPTDGSAYGKAAIEYGIYLASKLDVRLTGFHVLDIRLLHGPAVTDISYSVGIPPCQDVIPLVERSLDERADAILAAFTAQCEKAGLRVETRKALGITEDAIIEAGENADWIILARRGGHIHLPTGGILGTTAESVVRKARIPVMVTPAAFREIESIGLAYDGSRPAQGALKLALDLSRDAAWPLTAFIVTDDHARGAKLAGKVEDLAEEEGIDAATIVMPGKEDVEIMKFIQEGAVELMVMGAYGHNRLRELLLGSTTSFIIRRSTIPVLLTREATRPA
jgi:nucleotide-binding universal stress UspA family protein